MKKLLTILLAAVPLLLQAGNIPQYQVSRGTNTYAQFTDGTKISASWTAGEERGVYPNGVTYASATTAVGFPIGFDFRFAGTTVNQFALTTIGRMYLGNDKVAWGGNTMSVGMFLLKNGLKCTTSTPVISYKTTGSEGNRVLHVQIHNALENVSYPGKYNLQYRLYEADGTIEIALAETETTYTAMTGFITGLWGVGPGDAMMLTGTTINPASELRVSPCTSPDLLNPQSYIKWDDNDYDRYYKPVYVFKAPADEPAEAGAPRNLTVTESAASLTVSCERAEGAEATVILWSNEPFAAGDYPVNGESFVTPKKFGNATAIYYGGGDTPTATIPLADNSKTYYFAAVSTNGYPNFNTADVATATFTPTHAAPVNFTATAAGADKAALSLECDCPVIVAMTTVKKSGYNIGYHGAFGTPKADAKVGDELEGGGKVIYVGDPAGFTADIAPNTLTFFSAWALADNGVSLQAAEAYCAGTPVLPYAPAVETYPTWEYVNGWVTTPAGEFDTSFRALTREFDGADVLYTKGVPGQLTTFTSPALPLGSPVKISFEFSLESVREADANGVPMGNEVGHFGDTGYLAVSAGGREVKRVTDYNGTMKTCPDGYETGSSTFETVEVEIPAVGDGETFTISFYVDAAAYLYIRNIRVEAIAEAPKAPALAPVGATATEDRHAVLHFSCRKADDAANTLVLFSPNPITTAAYPRDGVIPAVGSTTADDVTVMYYGSDETIDVATDYELVMPDFETPYYFVALSASANPLYNRENVAAVTYVTRGDMDAPTLGEVTVSGGQLTVKATRHRSAESTLLLLSEGEFSGDLVDGHNYNVGDRVGNATVIYHGGDREINHTVSLIARSVNYTVTAVSSNSLWWHDIYATANVSVDTTTRIDEINAADLDKDAEIYTLTGIRVHGIPAPGLYIVGGVKTLVK